MNTERLYSALLAALLYANEQARAQIARSCNSWIIRVQESQNALNIAFIDNAFTLDIRRDWCVHAFTTRNISDDYGWVSGMGADVYFNTVPLLMQTFKEYHLTGKMNAGYHVTQITLFDRTGYDVLCCGFTYYDREIGWEGSARTLYRYVGLPADTCIYMIDRAIRKFRLPLVVRVHY